MHSRIRIFAYPLIGIAIAIAALIAFPEVKRSNAKSGNPGANLIAATTLTEEGSATLYPENLKTWTHIHLWHSSLCSGDFVAGFTPEEVSGTVVAGYRHTYDKGKRILGCPSGNNSVHRGSVWFDLSEIMGKADPLHVSVQSATLHFKPLSGSCNGELLIATKNWLKGDEIEDLVPGDSFAKIGSTLGSGPLLGAKVASCGSGGCDIEVKEIVNNWLKGDDHGGYPNFGFVLKGTLEGDAEYSDNDACLARYGEFSLTVKYRYDKPLLHITLPTPSPTPIGRSGPGIPGGDATAFVACTNYAIGAEATAQNYTKDGVFPGLHFDPSYAIDGIRHTTTDGGNYWRDDDPLPSWLQVKFTKSRMIDEITVVTIQDPGLEKAIDPTDTQTFERFGATAFDVQYWTGTDWQTVPGGSITGNNLVVRKINFPPLTTTMIRVVVNGVAPPDKVARLVEVEACGHPSTPPKKPDGSGGASGLSARTETAFGLITTTFDTLQGTVSVNLPDDVAAGDTISGTVITEPKGTTKDEQAKNEDSLNGFVVEVAKQDTPTQQQGSKWVIPPMAQFIPVVLKNRNGEVVARTQVPVNQGTVVKPRSNGELPQQGSYSMPPFGQAGRPISVAGPFDGDFNNTAVNLGNNTAQFLAESPRKVVVRSPANLIGPSTIEINEQNKVVARCHYQSIGVRLAAGKLNLIRGEQTTVTVTLSGLDGATGPVPMQLTNASPATVRMEGGDTQTIIAQPGEVTGGVFTAKRTLTGIKPGGFAINAVVNPAIGTKGGGGVWKTCEAGPGAGPHNSGLNNDSLGGPINVFAVTAADIQGLDGKPYDFTGPRVGSPGSLPPLAQALDVARRGDVNGAKRWLLRF
ncbi:MAG: discoidin domain-containing protein [Acidobacteriota bacterium]